MADLSAHSGYNALARDPEHAVGFLERQRHKLLFGTDLLAADQRIDIATFLDSLPLSAETRRAVYFGNAARLLRLPDAPGTP